MASRRDWRLSLGRSDPEDEFTKMQEINANFAHQYIANANSRAKHFLQRAKSMNCVFRNKLRYSTRIGEAIERMRHRFHGRSGSLISRKMMTTTKRIIGCEVSEGAWRTKPWRNTVTIPGAVWANELEKVSRRVFSRRSLRKLHDQALAKRRKALETNYRKAGHIHAGQILPFELSA
jgi:hypothetical protein